MGATTSPGHPYGAIAFYLSNQADIDKHLMETEREFENSGIPMRDTNMDLWEKIQKARIKMADSGS